MLDYSIIDLDYLILTAGMRFDTGNPEGKTRASTFLFPYIEVLESDIQRESTINRLSAALGISEKALLSDYQNRKQPRPVNKQTGKDDSISRLFKISEEMPNCALFLQLPQIQVFFH